MMMRKLWADGLDAITLYAEMDLLFHILGLGLKLHMLLVFILKMSVENLNYDEIRL